MREIPRTAFGRRMFDARTRAGLTQSFVAQKIGVTQGTLAELEKKAEGSSNTVQLARLYSVSAWWLATGEGSMDEASNLSSEAQHAAELIDELPTQKDRETALAMLIYFLRRGAPPSAPIPSSAPAADVRPLSDTMQSREGRR